MQQTITLTTCKRSEVYHDGGIIDTREARHLFRLSAGLESPLLGETAILGQIKRNYLEAQQRGRLSPILNRLFQQAIHVGHRVRTETAISRGAVSYSRVDILCDELPDLRNKVVSIIGVNDLTESILNFLTARGATNILLANRSIEKAEVLAAEYDATALPLSEKRRLIALSDVVISATSAPHAIISRSDIQPSAKHRYFFDLANPRDIDSNVKTLFNVTLYDLEQVEHLAKQNIEARKAEVAKCEAIIEEELTELLRWQESRQKYAERRAG